MEIIKSVESVSIFVRAFLGTLIKRNCIKDRSSGDHLMASHRSVWGSYIGHVGFVVDKLAPD
jgi:hypothetical protein